MNDLVSVPTWGHTTQRYLWTTEEHLMTILAEAALFGHEAVIEYSPTVSWLSWGFVRDRRDTHLFAGRVTLIISTVAQPGHHKAKPRRMAKAFGLLGALVGATATAHVVGFESIYWGTNGPR